MLSWLGVVPTNWPGWYVAPLYVPVTCAFTTGATDVTSGAFCWLCRALTSWRVTWLPRSGAPSRARARHGRRTDARRDATIVDDTAVAEAHDPFRPLTNGRLMGDDDDGAAIRIERREDVEHFVGLCARQIAGRLVREDERGVADDGA